MILVQLLPSDVAWSGPIDKGEVMEYCTNYFFPVAYEALVGKASSLTTLHYHTQTYDTRLDSYGRVIGTTQIQLPVNTQHSQETDIHAPGGIRTRNPRKRAAADPRLSATTGIGNV